MYEAIPAELRRRKQWVCFKLVPKADRMDKLPVNPRTGEMAKSNDESTWGSFEEALQGVSRHGASGIGIMFGDGLCGVDIDHCVDGGELSTTAKEIVATLKSYTETSPSGTGVHVLALGKLPPPEGGRRRDGVEMYDTARFFTVTGNVYLDEDGKSYPLRECILELERVHRTYIYREPPKQMRLLERAVIPISLDDKTLLEKMFAGSGGERLRGLYEGRWEQYGIGDSSQSPADQALCNGLAFWFGRDAGRMDQVFRTSGLMREKWDRSVGGGATYGERTLKRAIQSCAEPYSPPVPHSSLPLPPAPPLTAKKEKIPEETATLSDPMDKEQGPRKRMGEAQVVIDPNLYTYDDTGNGYRFRDTYYKDVKFNHVDKLWMLWDGTRWKEDQTGEVKRRADDMLRVMMEEATVAENTELAKHVRRSRSNKNKEAFIREAQHMDGVYILPSEFDRYRNAINLQNGVMDLRKGILRRHNRDYYLSMMAGVAYDSKATCPTWERFLKDITLDDPELTLYLQRMVGYCLTGSTQEQVIFFLLGNGRNGKSTFVSTITSILGEYSKNTQPETVMLRDKNNSAARSDIARLKGARLVSTFEPNANCKLDEGMVKQMTGEDALTARFLYKAEFEFKPEFKIIMATNVKPAISGTDNGIWRRIKLIPFDAQIPMEKLDMRLPDKLQGELPGILNWAIEGAKGWYRHGLPRCQRIEAAVAEYRTEMDKVQQFCEDCVVDVTGASLQASAIYDVYRAWCTQRGERYPMGNNKFVMEFKRRYTPHKTAKYIEYLDVSFTERGLGLLDSSAPHHPGG